MKKSKYILISLSILLVGMFYAASVSFALDAPHNDPSGVYCNVCHYPPSAPLPWTLSTVTQDNTALNNLCKTCHSTGNIGAGRADFEEVLTHSSYKTDPSNAKGYGVWVMECRTCHHPHYQMQVRANAANVAANLDSGTQAAGSVTSTTLQDLSKNWTVDQFKDAILIPNTTYLTYMYRITGNTSNTLTVDGAMYTAAPYAGAGKSYVIRYGKLVKTQITTPNSGNKAVSFINNNGPKSFATSSTTVDGVCQVCHTKTQAFKNNGTMENSAVSGHAAGVAGTNCIQCHKHSDGFKGGGCDGCHGYPPLSATAGAGGLVNLPDASGTGAASPGAHGKHVVSSVMTCDACHVGQMTTATYSNMIEMGFSLGTGTYNGRATLANGYSYTNGNAGTVITQTGAMTCSVYCHDPGSVGNPSPAWTGALPDSAQCDSCHGGDKTSTSAAGVGPMTTGKHSVHIANTDANLATFACGRCHSGTVTTGNDRAITGTKHTNQVKNVDYDSLNTGAAANACAGLYCHSSGKGTSSALTIATDWNGAGTIGCNGCHGTGNGTGAPDYASGGAGAANANSHNVAAHVSSSGDCVKCHTSTTTDGLSISGSIHLNKTLDVTMNGAYDTDAVPANNYTATVGSKTCSATTCHGTSSPKWGGNTTNNTCTKCHGRGVDAGYVLTDSAPGAGGTGISTGGATASSDAKVGAHRSHLEPAASYNYTAAIVCAECHTVPTAFTDPDHANGTREVPMDGLTANANDRSVPGIPTYSASQCSNVYCHDSSRFKHGWAGGPNSMPSPTWNNTAYLGADKAINCGRCHGNPPGGDHPAAIANECNSCHPNVNALGTAFVDPSLHANGIVEGGGCDGCHGNPPLAASFGSGGMTGTNVGYGDTGATNPLSPGAHNMHVNADPMQGRNIKCDACHKGTAMPAAENKIDMGFHIDSVNFPGFNSSVTVTTGAFEGYDSLSNGFTWNSSSPGTTVTTTGDWNNTCSAVYCHGGGAAGKAAPLTGGTNTAPSWVGVDQAACGTCHGGSAFNTASVTPPTSGGHAKHAGSADLALSCNKCHASTPADMTHVSGDVAWSLDATDARIGALATYNTASAGSTGALAPSAVYGSCDTVYCHSNVQSSNPPTNAVTYKQPSWSGPVVCGDCHKAGPVGAGAEQDSGSHLTHVSGSKYSKACATCHQGAGTGTAKHADKEINVSMNLASYPVGSGVAAASYGGTVAPGDAYGSCSNVYCHSIVQPSQILGNAPLTGLPGEYKNPAWGTGPLNCGSCHTDMSTTTDLTLGTHKRHTNEPGVAEFECSVCHGAGYSSITVSYGAHADGTINTSFTGSAAGTNYSQAAGNTPGNGYGSCTTSACHGRGLKNWGASSAAPTCDKCHGSVVTAGTSSGFYDTAGSSASNYAGTHKSHLTGLHNYSDPIACEQCHVVPATVGASGHNDTLSPAELTWGNLASHGRILGVTTGATMTPNYNYSTRQCSNTYCHSGVRETDDALNDLGSQGTATTPVWGDPAYLGGSGCGKCHGNPPHYPHPQGAYASNCSACHIHVNPSNTGFVVSSPTNSGKSAHVDGSVQWDVDLCTDCHSYTSSKPLIGAHAVHTDPDYFLATNLTGTIYAGTATGGSATTLTDSGQAWGVDTLKNDYLLMITSGPNKDKQIKIVANTGTTLTLASAFPSSISAGNTYSIRGAKKLSANDYGDTTWHYTIHYKNGFPTYACGFCHPMDDVMIRNNNVVELDLDPAHSLDGTVKTKNSAIGPYSGQWYTRDTGVNVTCSGIYCHSNGYISQVTSTYQYKETPNWYSVTTDPTGSILTEPWSAVDRCAQCHGNSPNTDSGYGLTEGSSAHAKHAVGIHYEDTFSGTSGKMAATGASGAAHGNPATSTTVNCNLCHSDTVSVSYNDKNGTCNACHTGAATKGTLVVSPTSTMHINGSVDVVFGSFSVKTKAQLRDDIASVSELNSGWTRTNGYKASNSYDASKRTPSYVGGTCSTVDCHNGTPMQWSTQGPLSCNACHRGLPQ